MSCDAPDIYVTDLKVVLLGESSVGKSSIVMRYITGNFQRSNATIGAAFTTKTIEILESDNVIKRISLEIWDTAGQERYRSLAPMYFRNTDIALVVFDVTKPESLQKAQSWIEELNSYFEQDRRDDVSIKLIGNKIDLDHSSIETHIDEPIYEVSAMTGEGILELFNSLCRNIAPEKFRRLEAPPNNDGVIKLNQNYSHRSSYGCNC